MPGRALCVSLPLLRFARGGLVNITRARVSLTNRRVWRCRHIASKTLPRGAQPSDLVAGAPPCGLESIVSIVRRVLVSYDLV
eukprot:7713648-Pyramimonas_sp.AAC.1